MVSTVTATTTMKAAQATGQAKLGDFSKIALAEIPVPTPGHGEVLIRVVASSVNPVDWKLLEPGSFGPVSPIRFPHTLGFDVAGTIAAVGSGCAKIKIEAHKNERRKLKPTSLAIVRAVHATRSGVKCIISQLASWRHI